MTLISTTAAAYLVCVAPATIRTWTARGLLFVEGYDDLGRNLYDRDEVHRVDRQQRAAGAIRDFTRWQRIA